MYAESCGMRVDDDDCLAVFLTGSFVRCNAFETNGPVLYAKMTIKQ